MVDEVWSSYYGPFLEGHGVKGNGKKQRTNPSTDRTAIIERMYTRVLMELCMNRFNWKGLDDPQVGISPRFMEMNLIRFGLSVVFRERTTDKVIAMQGAPAGPLNYIQDPTFFTVVGPMFGGKRLKAVNPLSEQLRGEAVPVWSNYMRMPDQDIIYVYAKRLAETDRSIEINSESARRNKVAFANENQRLTMANIHRQMNEGQSIIYLQADMMNGESMQNIITALDLGVDPDTIIDLHVLRTRLWGECMGLLGFDFANQDKKERLVAAEVDANNSQVDGMRMVNLNARKQACELINRKFGTQLDVEYHITSETSDAEVPPAPQLGGATLEPVAEGQN